jgi:hypothetical protein
MRSSLIAKARAAFLTALFKTAQAKAQAKNLEKKMGARPIP